MRALVLWIGWSLLLCGCIEDSREVFSLDPEEVAQNYSLLTEAAGFNIKEGYHIELIAAEPLIEAPVAIDWDREGRLWVLEMPDYMPDIDGVDEYIPRGRIVMLTDQDGDGGMDQAQTIIDSLHQPRAMTLVYGGLLWAESPYLYFADIQDDKLGTPVVVDSIYATGGNVEHQPNGLLLNVDNWIYNAKSNYRYKKDGDTWLKEPTAFRGQWGITHDAWGRIYSNDNSNGLYGDHVLPGTATAHPYYDPHIAVRQDILGVRDIHPAHVTVINRGYTGVLAEDGKVQFMTSTCGPMISLGAVAKGNALICVPEGNLIKRVTVNYEDLRLKAKNSYNDSEFITSMDEAFRPVNMRTGVDDAIYVVDFHRGVIQHKTYMTSYLRELLIERGLDEAVGMGRIWKITKDDALSSSRIISAAQSGLYQLINHLDHPNGEIRLRAQHELILRKDQNTIQAIIKSIQSLSPLGQLHALYTLEGLSVDLDKVLINLKNITTPDLIAHVVKLAEERASEQTLSTIINRYIKLSSEAVDVQIAHSIGSLLASNPDAAIDHYRSILYRYPQDEVIIDMILSGIEGNETTFERLLAVSQYPTIVDGYSKLMAAMNADNKVPIHQPPRSMQIGGKSKGLALFATHCAACHGGDGNGIKGLAPSLYGAVIVDSDINRLGLTLYTGLTGAVHINGAEERYNAAMPGLLANQELTIDDVTSIISYVSNAYSSNPSNISSDRVKYLKEKAASFSSMPTEAEILSYNLTQ